MRSSAKERAHLYEVPGVVFDFDESTHDPLPERLLESKDLPRDLLRDLPLVPVDRLVELELPELVPEVRGVVVDEAWEGGGADVVRDLREGRVDLGRIVFGGLGADDGGELGFDGDVCVKAIDKDSAFDETQRFF